MTREITHMKAFTAALESLGKPRFSIGRIPPTPGLVDQFFNDSTGAGEDGEIDARGPWNQGEDVELVESPAFQALGSAGDETGSAIDDRTTEVAAAPEMIQELLVGQLQDLAHAEGQLLKGLQTMIDSSRAPVLKFAFEKHLSETEDHVERLKEAFKLLAASEKPNPCKGMAGLLEEGEEVIAEGEEQEDVAADLGLIAAAQKIEHYEISAYSTARSLAGQAGRSDVAALLSRTLAEEEVADSLLTQIARELMGEARGLTKEPVPSRGGPGRKKIEAGGRGRRSK
jgi:Mn-containing catalase